MTTITIKVREKNGKQVITWLEQSGDELPQQLWDNFVLQTNKVFN